MLRHFPLGRTQCPEDGPGGPSSSTVPSKRRRRTRLAIGLLLVTALGCTTLSAASADDEGELKHERSEVNEDIDNAESALDESSKRLVRTTNAYQSAKQELGEARDTLDSTQAQLKVAKAYDQTMQTRLANAEQELEDAKSDLSAGRGRVADAKEKAQQYLIDQATNGEPGLRALSSLLQGESSSEFGVRMDYTSAVNEAQTARLDDFDASAVMLELRRDRVQDARDRVATERRKAARNLELKKELERQAEQETVEVAGLVDRTEEAQQAADRAKEADLAQLDDLEDERDRISGMLQEIAAEERQEALQEQREQQQQQNNGGSNGNDGGNNGGNPRGNGGPPQNTPPPPDTGFSLGYPVGNAYITSPYGMRFHPILHYYKLHDGTDFSAACGTPVLASEDGTVTSAYYNAGYGNRIILSHGYHNGVSLATSYNHMTSFSVGVGQRVSKGQVIGYSGTTGYSTGCHMHFMVYENGSTVDPMSWL